MFLSQITDYSHHREMNRVAFFPSWSIHVCFFYFAVRRNIIILAMNALNALELLEKFTIIKLWIEEVLESCG